MTSAFPENYKIERIWGRISAELTLIGAQRVSWRTDRLDYCTAGKRCSIELWTIHAWWPCFCGKN